MANETVSGLSENEQQVYERLQRYSRFARLVRHTRDECVRQGRSRTDSPYDKALWEIVGDPNRWHLGGHHPKIRRTTPEGEIIYDTPRVSGCTANHLIHIRETSQPVEGPQKFFAISINLRTGERQEWWVLKKVIQTSPGPSARREIYILNDQPDETWPLIGSPVHSGDLLLDSLIAEEREASRLQFDAERPKLVIDEQRSWFVPEQGARPEVFETIEYANGEVGRFELTYHTSEQFAYTVPEPQAAVGVLALREQLS